MFFSLKLLLYVLIEIVNGTDSVAFQFLHNKDLGSGESPFDDDLDAFLEALDGLELIIVPASGFDDGAGLTFVSAWLESSAITLYYYDGSYAELAPGDSVYSFSVRKRKLL